MSYEAFMSLHVSQLQRSLGRIADKFPLSLLQPSRGLTVLFPMDGRGHVHDPLILPSPFRSLLRLHYLVKLHLYFARKHFLTAVDKLSFHLLTLTTSFPFLS